MPGEFQLRGEKTDQRCICFSFDRLRAQFDLNRASMFANDTVNLGVGNDVNANNCHLVDPIRMETKSLDRFLPLKTFTSAASLVAGDWNIARRRIVRIPAFLFLRQLTLDRTNAAA